MFLDLLTTGLTQGLVIACVAYAILIPFKLLNVQDMSAEGAYPLGGALCAQLLLAGYSPGVALLGAALGGSMIGLITCFIHLRLRIHSLLAGIIVSTMAYSVNLHVMGRPNLALFSVHTLFEGFEATGKILLLLGIIAGIIAPFFAYLKTGYGLRFRAVGLNQAFARAQNIEPAHYLSLGMALAGAIAGVAGGLMVQLQQYMDISLGTGIVIHGLAALMLGETISGSGHGSLSRLLAAPLLGALAYQQIQGIALAAGLAASDIKFFTGALVLGIIAMRVKSLYK